MRRVAEPPLIFYAQTRVSFRCVRTIYRSLRNETLIRSQPDFIAHDPTAESIVVAHEGTDSKNMCVIRLLSVQWVAYVFFSLSILNDAKFGLVDLNATRFPSTAGQGIKVHSGFQQTFERTADGLLAGVMKGLASTGVKKVGYDDLFLR